MSIIQFESPAENAALKGTVVLKATPAPGSGVEAVEYLLNGRRLSGATYVWPFTWSWNTFGTWDGYATLTAVAHGRGRELARVERRVFVDNLGIGGAHMQLDLRPLSQSLQSLSGTVQWTATLGAVGEWRLVGWDATIDGVDARNIASHGGTFGRDTPAHVEVTVGPLDTTRWRNGRHELSLMTQGISTRDPLLRRPLALLQLPITISNDTNNPIGLRPLFDRVYLDLQTRRTATVRVALDYAQPRPWADFVGATFAVEGPPDAAPVAVDARGVLTARRPGQATLAINAAVGGRPLPAARVSVEVVERLAEVPHFTASGALVNSLRPDSIFCSSAYALGLNPPETLKRVAAAGFKALETGVGLPTRWPNDEAFLADWNSLLAEARRVLTNPEHRLSLVLRGDDLFELEWMFKDALAHIDAVKRALTAAAATGICVGMHMIDEVVRHWGPTPVPAGSLQGGGGTMPTDAVTRFMNGIGPYPQRPAVTWDVDAGASVASWEGDPRFADYAMIYWRTLNIPIYPEGFSLAQLRAFWDDYVVGSLRLVQPTRPAIMLLGASGPAYNRYSTGGEYLPGVDELTSPGVTPEAVSMQAMLAVAHRAAGLRAYTWDLDDNKRARREAVTQSGQAGVPVQTGFDDSQVGTDRFYALAASLGLINRFLPFIFGRPMHTPPIDEDVVTAARECSQGFALLAVNCSEGIRDMYLNLEPYMARAAGVQRYSLCGGRLALTDDVLKPRLVPGEAGLWIFPFDAKWLGPLISITSPLHGATVTGSVRLKVMAPGASSVTFSVDGHEAATLGPPFEWVWDTAGASLNVWHGISAIARDTVNRTSEARTVLKVVRNPLAGPPRPPVPTIPPR